MTPEQKEEIEVIVKAAVAANKPPSIWKDWRFVLGIPGAALAFVVLWATLGLPTIATSADVKRVERVYAEVAVQAYQNAINNLIANTPPADAPTSQQRAWQQQLDQVNKSLDRAIAKKVELAN